MDAPTKYVVNPAWFSRRREEGTAVTVKLGHRCHALSTAGLRYQNWGGSPPGASSMSNVILMATLEATELPAAPCTSTKNMEMLCNAVLPDVVGTAAASVAGATAAATGAKTSDSVSLTSLAG